MSCFRRIDVKRSFEQEIDGSLFSFSDRPEIYSNGFRIRFDAENGPIGFILPSWIPEKLDDEEEFSGWKTRIRLPLKTKTEEDRIRCQTLVDRFDDIQPSLLLFLNRIRSITIDNRRKQTRHVYQRRDLADSRIVEINSESINEKWFVVKEKVQIPPHIRSNVESTEICLAFPLHEINPNLDRSVLTKKDVFAFLPLRTVSLSLNFRSLKPIYSNLSDPCSLVDPSSSNRSHISSKKSRMIL